MREHSPQTPDGNDAATNLFLFPIEFSVFPVAPAISESPLPHYLAPSLADITAEWGRLLKRLGRRRRLLETLLSAGQPIRLTANTLIVGFPAQRRFHQELLDMPDYRACVEEELTRMFRTRLYVVTAAYPESRGLRRHGVVDKAPA